MSSIQVFLVVVLSVVVALVASDETTSLETETTATVTSETKTTETETPVPTTEIESENITDIISTTESTDSATTERTYKECGQPGVAPKLQQSLFTNLIVNGKKAVPHSWPWQVRMQVRDYQNHKLWHGGCGGSIITPYDIVTAAHCFNPEVTKRYPPGWFTNPMNWRILVGAHNISKFSNGYTIAKVVDVDIHKKYSSPAKAYDIAIVTLLEPIEFSVNASAVCLSQADFPPNSLCYATGWGSDEEGGNPITLRQAGVRILRSDICRHYYRSTLDETMICAGNRAEGPDTCQGDSGGPLVCQNSYGIWGLQGITSFGNDCGEQPGVYTRVSHFADWINDRTNNAYKRRKRHNY